MDRGVTVTGGRGGQQGQGGVRGSRRCGQGRGSGQARGPFPPPASRGGPAPCQVSPKRVGVPAPPAPFFSSLPLPQPAVTALPKPLSSPEGKGRGPPSTSQHPISAHPLTPGTPATLPPHGTGPAPGPAPLGLIKDGSKMDIVCEAQRRAPQQLPATHCPPSPSERPGCRDTRMAEQPPNP